MSSALNDRFDITKHDTDGMFWVDYMHKILIMCMKYYIIIIPIVQREERIMYRSGKKITGEQAHAK